MRLFGECDYEVFSSLHKIIKEMNKYLKLVGLSFLGVLVSGQLSIAQCPMCRMTLESNYQNGGTAGAGINGGILYMLVMPYIIVGTIAFVWLRNRKRNTPSETLQPSEN